MSTTVPVSSSPSGLELANFPHLSQIEWDALLRLSNVIGAGPVKMLLRNGSEIEQRSAALGFMQQEISANSSAKMPKMDSLKVEVSTYKGEEKESLLRWLVELDAGIDARAISDHRLKVAFAMSRLAGRAKKWAFGKRMADPQCFPKYESFKDAIKLAFEPPKCEFRARAEFLKLKQGKRDLHAYIQEARYLIASIVNEPVDNATQVVTFMTGLNDGPVKTYLFREYPKSLEDAISIASMEDFSLKQAKASRSDGFQSKPKPSSDPTPMDCSSITDPKRGRNGPRRIDRTKIRCYRCQKTGHYSSACTAPQPVPRSSSDSTPKPNSNGVPKEQKNVSFQ